MSDLISVRVTLDSYDLVHPSQKQTQVYVQIPEVACASWLLDASFYALLKNEPWPHVIDSAHEEYEQRGVVSDTKSAAARQAIVDWLLLSDGADYDARYDAVQAAWEADQARQYPVARKLLGENELLRARVAELEAQRDRRRDRLVALQNDALNMRGALSPMGEGRKVPFPLGETLAPAVEWLISRVAELEGAQSTVFVARRDSRVLGLYTLSEDALHHCEDALGRTAGYSAATPFSWRERPDGARELFAWTSQEVESATGFTVARLELRDEFDEGWGEDADVEVAPAEADALTALLVPVQALREDADTEPGDASC